MGSKNEKSELNPGEKEIKYRKIKEKSDINMG